MPSSRNRVSHAKEAFYIVCIVIFLLISLFAYVGPGGFLEMKEMQSELSAHQARVEELEAGKKERMKSIEALRDDRKNNEAIERYARQKGYGRKGEIIQEVPQAEPNQPSTRVK